MGSPAEGRGLALLVIGVALLAGAAIVAVAAEGPLEDPLEAVSLVLGPVGLFVAVEGYLIWRRARVTGR